MKWLCVCMCLLLAGCGAGDGATGSPGTLSAAVTGPVYTDDAEAVEVFTAAFKQLDYDAMQAAWGRMNFQQRRAADLAVGAWLDGLSTDEYARFEDAQEMLRAFDWGATP